MLLFVLHANSNSMEFASNTREDGAAPQNALTSHLPCYARNGSGDDRTYAGLEESLAGEFVNKSAGSRCIDSQQHLACSRTILRQSASAVLPLSASRSALTLPMLA